MFVRAISLLASWFAGECLKMRKRYFDSDGRVAQGLQNGEIYGSKEMFCEKSRAKGCAVAVRKSGPRTGEQAGRECTAGWVDLVVKGSTEKNKPVHEEWLNLANKTP